MTESLPRLILTDRYSWVEAGDRAVAVYACDNYGEDPVWLDAAEVRQLRDWLNVWLEQRERC